METGNIQYINKEKGFGFITPSGKDASVKGNNIFFHCSRVVDLKFEDIQINDKVGYTEEESQKGLQAVNVAAYQKSKRT